MRDREDAPLEIRVSVMAARVDAMERDLRAHAQRLEDIGRAVDALRLQDEVAAGVKQALAARSDAQATATAEKVKATGAPIVLTWPQKIGGLVAGAILVIDAVRGLVG